LDLDNRVGRAGPLRYRGRVISERAVVEFVDKDAKEGGSLVVRVGLEVGVDFDNECRGDGREQTGLSPVLACVNQTPQGTHEDQGRVQIFIVLLYEFFIILLSLSAVVLKELSPVVLLSVWGVLFTVEWTSSHILIEREKNLPACPFPIFPPFILLHLDFSRVLTVIEYRERGIGRLWGACQITPR